MSQNSNRRILVIDDNTAIHDDVRRVLAGESDLSDLADAESALFGDASAPKSTLQYTIDSAHQGQEGYRMVCEAVARGERYHAAFVDMRMPPGWDGVETIEKIWEKDPDLQVVICTAYSDHSWSDLIKRLGTTDRLLILKKPFDAVEVSQLACSLTEKWQLARKAQLKSNEMENIIVERTHELEQLNLRLQYDAFHDSLTGLSNRAMLIDRLNRCIARASRERTFQFGLMFLDLDRFKVINDSLGHLAGDELLIGVANRLEESLRGVDTVSRLKEGDIARFGGDEFILLAEGVNSVDALVAIARRIQNLLAKPFLIDGHDVVISASIGLAIGDPTYVSAEAIMRDADIALYRAKANGRATFQLFDHSMHEGAMVRLKLETQLRAALDAGQLFLVYQPIISLADNRLHGLEALVRWQHPDRGELFPAEFIPIAEETGLIAPLTDFVLAEACRQTRQWQLEFGLEDLTVSVNLSGKQLDRPNLLTQIRSTLRETGLSPSCLCLEVTETAVWENAYIALKTMADIRDLGVKLHLDDFGTGQSSLSHVQRLPVDALKIDRSFVSTATRSESSRAICDLIIALARALNITCIAEGVESHPQLDLLTQQGCTLAQGYLFSHPLPAGELAAYLAASLTAAA